ncbi:DUF2726 domain-containing protein [Deinococcus sp. HMF7604]|uniref:DUF2726 domain-containing protein n=1 Tax=Deinococcus betulae TaxID=2873312 RepID=UPI001CCFEC08|nr:DUF2726 domain-containing protein [Deinococcus betulae]
MSIVLLILGVLLVSVLVGWLSAQGKSSRVSTRSVPTSLPVQAKRYFFARSERALYDLLTQMLAGTSYQVFPNVRLNDLFLIKGKGTAHQATLGRLRDKHVDFVIVDAGQDFRPLVAIELDGASHEAAAQKYRDQVKDVIFRSGGLPLLRLKTSDPHSSASLKVLLAPYLGQVKVARAR